MSTAVFTPLSLELALPWSPDEQQEQKLKRWAKYVFISLLVIFIVVPFLPVFESQYIPPAKAIVKTKVILDPVVVPPPVKPKVIPKPKPKPKSKPKAAPKPKLKKTNASQKKAASPVKKKPVDTKKALLKSTGLSSLSAELAAIRGSVNMAGMKKKATKKDKGVVATVNRNILGENRADSANFSDAVNDEVMKNDEVTLGSHKTTDIKVSAAGGDYAGVKSYGSFKAGQRDMESIRRMFEAKKGSVYSLYNRALSNYPELHGKFIFQLIIQADGHVTDIALLSSELNMPDLEKEILARIEKINFGAADVSATSVEYKFVFFPS